MTGATGKQGGATARRLLAVGRRVRALVRDAESPAARELAAAGAELAVGDFDEPGGLGAALTGVDSAFLVPPATFGPNGWDVGLEVERGTRFIEAAQAAGVEFVVFTTVASYTDDGKWGAQGKRQVEEALRNSGLHWTILRPARFMENYFMRGYPVDGINDVVHKQLFPADRPIQAVAVADIAVFAQLAFDDPARFHGETLELAGDALTIAGRRRGDQRRHRAAGALPGGVGSRGRGDGPGGGGGLAAVAGGPGLARRYRGAARNPSRAADSRRVAGGNRCGAVEIAVGRGLRPAPRLKSNGRA